MSKRITILAAAAAVAVGLVVLLASQRAPESEGSLLAGPVMPGLADRLNDVTSIRIVQAGDQPVLTLARTAGGWTVAERDGYPANAGKIRTALLNLAESKVVEAKTANPERYAQLGVEDVDGETAAGVRIELAGAGMEPAALIVGNYAGQQGEGTYVRRPGEAQSLMAAGNLVPERQVGDWLRRELTDIASSRIQQVELVENDGRPLRIFKASADDANFQVADVPRGRTLQSEVVANGLASTLSGLTLDDVARADADAQVPADATRHRAAYTLFDGVVVTLDGHQAPADADGNAGLAHVTIAATLDRERALARIAADIAAEQAAAQADADAAAAAAPAGADAAPATAPGETDAAEAPTAPAAGVAATGAEGDAASPAAAVPAAAIDVEARTAERLAALQADVDEINARLGGWRFQIPAFKYATIDKTIDDLLQPLED
jgi:hypothetical protein